MTNAAMQRFDGSGAEWNALIASLPGAHLLQTWEWAEVKARYGWAPMPYVWRRIEPTAGSKATNAAQRGDVVAAAMILRRAVLNRGFARRMCILYLPKGPVLDPMDADLREDVLHALEELGRREGAILVKIDPDMELDREFEGTETARASSAGAAWSEVLSRRAWRYSDSQIQFRNSVWIYLNATTADLLARMKQKTRYNIHLAERKGVRVRVGSETDFALLYRMYAETAQRDEFVIRDEAYYRDVWSAFLREPAIPSKPAAQVLVAEVSGEVVAAVWIFCFAGRAYYLYGMSRAAHREKMPNYLLQWEAIKRAQEWGCRVYDLWGAPEQFDERDPMWGVFRFKEGLGGYVVRTIGAWDFPSGGFWYRLYRGLMPRVLAVMRRRGRRRVVEGLGGP